MSALARDLGIDVGTGKLQRLIQLLVVFTFAFPD